jgi:hypothetical protein
MFLENVHAKQVLFAEGHGFEAASALQAEAETANSAEQVKHAELAHNTLRSFAHVERTTLIVWR